MIYRDFRGERLSALGYGTMRLPTGADGAVDEKEAIRLIRSAYERGVNYFDSAYTYQNGASERVMGKALEGLPRASFNVATKFPGHEFRPSFDPKEIFEDQLSRVRVKYFDYYLFHNVYERSINVYLDRSNGILDYILEQKRNGRIRHLGFSCHGRLDTLTRFLDEVGDELEFCQIQFNYLDWILQDAKSKYELLTERGIPIWVMEPVRGGRLAKLSPENEAMLKAARPDESIPAWAFRWQQSKPNVTMVLSGMSAMEQLDDNIKTFESSKPVTPDEDAMLEKVARSMMDMIPCTGCRYCCHGCPMGLDIPTFLSIYNDISFQKTLTGRMAVDALPIDKRPSACLACGACMKVCPQNLEIPKLLKELTGLLDTIPDWAVVSAERARQMEAEKEGK